MGKTYNRKGSVLNKGEEYIEYHPNFHNGDQDELNHMVDISHTTFSDRKEDIYRDNSRHPNKKSHKDNRLKKENKLTKSIINYRDRFGERDMKSDRLKGIRKSFNGTRRQSLKRITKKLIEEI